MLFNLASLHYFQKMQCNLGSKTNGLISKSWAILHGWSFNAFNSFYEFTSSLVTYFLRIEVKPNHVPQNKLFNQKQRTIFRSVNQDIRLFVSLIIYISTSTAKYNTINTGAVNVSAQVRSSSQCPLVYAASSVSASLSQCVQLVGLQSY